jgi:hypothetical protein
MQTASHAKTIRLTIRLAGFGKGRPALQTESQGDYGDSALNYILEGAAGYPQRRTMPILCTVSRNSSETHLRLGTRERLIGRKGLARLVSRRLIC